MPLKTRPTAYTSIAALVLLTAALLTVAPNTLRFAFPALAALTAAVVFRQSRTLYLQLCLWLWFLSPLLRRMVDYRTEFLPTSPLLLAPFFACAVSGVVLLRHPRLLATRGAIAFPGAFAGIFFGTVYGLTRYPSADVARGLVNWLPPVFFGFFLYAERARQREYRDTLQRTLLWATLLLGVYGIAQFFLLPAWDESWMRACRTAPSASPCRSRSASSAP